MSQKLSVNNFYCIKDTSQLNEDFIKNYNEESDEGYFLEVDAQYLEKLHNTKLIIIITIITKLHNDLPFLPERIKLKTQKSL